MEICSLFCNLIALDAFWLDIFIPTLLTDLVPEIESGVKIFLEIFGYGI